MLAGKAGCRFVVFKCIIRQWDPDCKCLDFMGALILGILIQVQRYLENGGAISNIYASLHQMFATQQIIVHKGLWIKATSESSSKPQSLKDMLKLIVCDLFDTPLNWPLPRGWHTSRDKKP